MLGHIYKYAEKIQQFRPICLLNCIYTWFTNVLTLRLEPVAEKIIHKVQTAFIKKRNIMNGVLVLYEIFHETKKRGQTGVVLKLDFEKAYDKVCWEFLFKCLSLRGFNATWCKWVEKVVKNGTVSVKLDNQLGAYFKSHKGVRMGDPLSPLLFNIVADCLTRMIHRAQANRLVVGLAENIIPNGVAILPYDDDTILCMKDDLEGARNIKLLLSIYEQMSGLKINFEKSEILITGVIIKLLYNMLKSLIVKLVSFL